MGKIYISHRGNLNGRVPELENNPGYIHIALSRGIHCEVDVWFEKGGFWLGHDEPRWRVDISFLKDNRLWCHAKNIEALFRMEVTGVHCFYHFRDDVVLTSRGYLWTYPGKRLTSRSICVLPEVLPSVGIEECAGICSDHILSWRNYEIHS